MTEHDAGGEDRAQRLARARRLHDLAARVLEARVDEIERTGEAEKDLLSDAREHLKSLSRLADMEKEFDSIAGGITAGGNRILDLGQARHEVFERLSRLAASRDHSVISE